MTWMSPVLAVSIPECFVSAYVCFTEAWFCEARYLIVYLLKPVVAGQDKETRYYIVSVLQRETRRHCLPYLETRDSSPQRGPELPSQTTNSRARPFRPCRSAGAASTWKLKKPLWPSERPSKT
ncbi:hypothetical protein BJX66DRAFT_212244 [Aspergillus keveii]|uniref:Uncharacterized protein n=1 Tax=Aspergillus keveii TaxID=714993 RepID=A0ABR4GLW0_9EURO